MAFIASGTTTVGEAVDYSVDFLLRGLYAERKPGKGVRLADINANRAARAALENLQRFLNEVWCDDGNTLLKDVTLPKGKPSITEVLTDFPRPPYPVNPDAPEEGSDYERNDG